LAGESAHYEDQNDGVVYTELQCRPLPSGSMQVLETPATETNQTTTETNQTTTDEM
jgi:hypothetical protein